MRISKLVQIAKTAGQDFARDRVMSHAAALAFYTSLSLAPLVVLLALTLGSLDPGAEQYLIEQARQLIGTEGAELIRTVIENAEARRFSGPAGLISMGTLLFAGSAVFVQLQAALNAIWEVRARPGGGLWPWLRKRGLSFGMVGAIAFLMLVSLFASALLDTLGLGESGGVVARVVSVTLSVGVFTALFAAVFKFLPDVRVAWRDVLGGAFVTSILFSIGKTVIGVYLAHKGLGSAYGAAGSAIVVLAWVYFSAILLFAGAELTQAWLKVNGRHLEPNKYAIRTEPAPQSVP